MKYKILVLSVVFACFVLVFLISVNKVHLQSMKQDKNEDSKKICGLTKENLTFCSNSQSIVIDAGSDVTLNFSILNENKETVFISVQDITQYIFKVTDKNGDFLSTKIETAIKQGSLDSEKAKHDFISQITTNHRSRCVESNKTLEEKIILSKFYDFSEKGRYFVEVTRKTTNVTGEGIIEIPLGKVIEIEVR
jgi:hypothetical protein